MAIDRPDLVYAGSAPAQKKGRGRFDTAPGPEPASPERRLVRAGAATPVSGPEDEPQRDQQKPDRKWHPERKPCERQL
jgi:hypothetical protein